MALTWGQKISGHYTIATGLGYIESQRRSLLILISHLWDMYDKLWIKRSSKFHDDTDIHALSTKELNRRIRFFFEKRRVLFDQGDQDRFHLGLDHTL